MAKQSKNELKAAQLRYYPELEKYEGKTTKDIEPSSQFALQKRGFDALDFGRSISKKGFNIYVAGEPGSGKTSNVRKYLEKIAKKMPTPDDLLYVYNFEDNDSPKLLFLKAGSGEEFVADMADLLDTFIEQIPHQLESENFEIKRSEVNHWYSEVMQQSFAELEHEAAELDFAIRTSENGIVLNPIVDGKPIDRDGFEALSDKQKAEIEQHESVLQEKLIAYFHRERQSEKEFKERMTKMYQQMVDLIISEPLRDIQKKYPKNKMLAGYLEEIANYTIENYEDFLIYRNVMEGKADPMKVSLPDFHEYHVNLLINNRSLEGAPVVYETNPTFQNIVGYFEYEEIRNSLVTDFTKLKPGALHRANGGFLILQVDDILKNYYAWTALKRSLRNRTINVDDIDTDFKYRVSIVPTPEPVPLDVKVILIGDFYFYHLLYEKDPDFRRIFKVKADFDSVVPVTAASTESLIGFISRVANEDCSLPFDTSALRRLLNFSSRLAGDQKKYSIHASDLVEVIIEANFLAEQKRRKFVSEEFVVKAIENREERHIRFRENYYESIENGTILIDVKGSRVGQINGLAVYTVGDFSFGIPSRITAKVFAGQREIVNIEREAMLSGSIHDKGAMILAGFLGGLFAVKKPLSFSASLAFEQSYGGVDGDSASSTELYALCSALSDLPIKQSIAVTGSINQMGEIQPIGGANEKIEGFYEICKIRGLTGDQGVIIPIQNVRNLNLSDEIIRSVEEGKFHIYAISNITEGIEILTGVPAGKRGANGKFAKGTVFARIDEKLAMLRGDDDDDKDGEK